MVMPRARRAGLESVVMLTGMIAVGCYDLKKADTGIELAPDDHGVVRIHELGIQGRWYAYGDRYDVPARCESLGRHLPQNCSLVASPDTLPGFATPTNGAMCIAGQVAPVIPCLKPTQVECLAVPSSSAGGDGRLPPAPGAGGAEAWDAEPYVYTWDFPRADCNCHDPTCMPAGQSCYCSPIPPLPCTGRPDYPNIWGAGIGLDFVLKDTAGRNPLERAAWDPAVHGITGVAFDFSMTELPAGPDPLRVEFPMLLPASSHLPSLGAGAGMSSDGPDWTGTASLLREGFVRGPSAAYPDSTYDSEDGEFDLPDGSVPVPSEEHPSGSPFWHELAGNDWSDPKTGRVRQGHNVIHFSEVHAPPFSQLDPGGTYNGVYAWDPQQLLGIQFLVPSRSGQADTFSFCISNLTFIRD